MLKSYNYEVPGGCTLLARHHQCSSNRCSSNFLLGPTMFHFKIKKRPYSNTMFYTNAVKIYKWPPKAKVRRGHKCHNMVLLFMSLSTYKFYTRTLIPLIRKRIVIETLHFVYFSSGSRPKVLNSIFFKSFGLTFKNPPEI